MSPLDEVAPGLWRFTVTRNGIPPTMTAYALRDGEDTILVDPLVAGETEPLLAALDEIVRGRVRILVTTPFHVRSSELLCRRWRDYLSARKRRADSNYPKSQKGAGLSDPVRDTDCGQAGHDDIFQC